jgi:hypothetical protein
VLTVEVSQSGQLHIGHVGVYIQQQGTVSSVDGLLPQYQFNHIIL